MTKTLLLTVLALAAIGCQAASTPATATDASSALVPDRANPAFEVFWVEHRLFSLVNRSPYDVQSVSGRVLVWDSFPDWTDAHGTHYSDDISAVVRLNCDKPIPAGGQVIVQCYGDIHEGALRSAAKNGWYEFVFDSVTYGPQETE